MKPLFAFRRADFQVEVCPFQVISVSKYFASARHLVSWQNFQLETTHTAFPAFDPPLLNTAAPGIFPGSPVGSPFYFPSSMAAAVTHAHASDVVVTTVDQMRRPQVSELFDDSLFTKCEMFYWRAEASWGWFKVDGSHLDEAEATHITAANHSYKLNECECKKPQLSTIVL